LNFLTDALTRHVGCETASFHTPGHKGQAPVGAFEVLAEYPWQMDLTELPGLDDLSSPTGVLADLESRAAGIWGAAESIISVNGASAGMVAAMLALASRGSSTVLVPRNAHRSIVSGLVISGLFPIWYDPVWDDDWGIWGSLPAKSVERLLERCGGEPAGLVITSPTYAGAISDIERIAGLCHSAGIPLVVDEAHGAHLLGGGGMPPGAVTLGADVVVHSLHKTLPALTQTGLVHVGRQSLIAASGLRSALQLVQTSSPSYLLMASIEQALAAIEAENGGPALSRLQELSVRLVEELAAHPELEVYKPLAATDPAHVLVAARGRQPQELFNFLCERGVFPETTLGRGVLLMLGLGSTAADVGRIVSLLPQLAELQAGEAADSAFARGARKSWRQPDPVQVISPRQAFFMPSEVVPAGDAVGRLSAVTIAPCPPGTPLIVAGQRVPPEILEYASLQSLKVVLE